MIHIGLCSDSQHIIISYYGHFSDIRGDASYVTASPRKKMKASTGNTLWSHMACKFPYQWGIFRTALSGYLTLLLLRLCVCVCVCVCVTLLLLLIYSIEILMCCYKTGHSKMQPNLWAHGTFSQHHVEVNGFVCCFCAQDWSMIWQAWVHVSSRQFGRLLCRTGRLVMPVEHLRLSCCNSVVRLVDCRDAARNLVIIGVPVVSTLFVTILWTYESFHK